MMIEALVAILVFSLGILGMLAMGGTAIASQSDARYRTDAARLVDDLASAIALRIDRTSDATKASSIAVFQHQPGGTGCSFSGAASTDPLITEWLGEVTTTGAGKPGLPGTLATGQQVIVSNAAGGFNRVEITVCWRAPGTAAGVAMRRHTLVTFVN